MKEIKLTHSLFSEKRKNGSVSIQYFGEFAALNFPEQRENPTQGGQIKGSVEMALVNEP